MAMTFTPISDHGKNARSIGDIQMVIGVLTVSGSYAAGGEVPTAVGIGAGLKAMFKQKGEGTVLAVLGGRGVGFDYDNANDKLKIYAINPAAASADVAPAELPAAAYDADLSGQQIVVLGK